MKLKHLFFLAVAGTLAVACSEVNENSLTDGDGQRMLRTISSGNDRFSTRLNSETSEWESGDAIGIYMFDTEDKNVLNDALNVKYTTIGEGLTVNFSSDPGIAIYDMPTNFVAYYPHATSADVIDATAALYKVDISDQSNGISAHDLMWAKAANQSTESLLAGGLAFTFHHQLVLLRVNITNENVSNVTSVTVGGINTTATFNLIDGTLNNIGTQKSVALQKKDNKSFIGIMLPTEELKNKLSLTILADGGKYQYTVPETSKIDKFVAGNEYTFDITVGKETSGEVGGGSGSNTPWGDGGNEEGNGDKVSENEAIPADYAQKAITAETDLSTVLSGASGKAALVFAANADGYTFSDVMVVPEAVTELLLIGDAEEQVKVNLKQIQYTSLQKIALNNLDITGDNSTALLTNSETAQLATDAVVDFKKCNFTNMKTVCDWSTGDNGAQNVLSAVFIDDCQFVNMQSVFNYYGSKAITITNSTIYKMTERAIYVKDANSVVITVENCTLADLAKTPFESRYGNGNLYYKNNISACFVTSNPNIGYKMDVREFSGNYAAAATEAGQLAVLNVHGKAIDTNTFPNAWTDTSKTVAELFEDAANGNFKLKIDAQAGDPRWYKNAR
ncbi:fimbrillin family protein [Bacteroides xylanisolvens]|uniref:fimbrillin family protein n=1 Tax=Bacteroides xylanisolvens TaxID=371601 RepID=UPI0023070110|nr:fimbrillin family protein [Bacteroides xylanisolvens]MDB0719012.1 fimbrillin family protein [Bacteroides xylanisolvens]MDB0738252.1 fimbrillin family protein [Bacteroides xylanisolvens]